MLTAYRVPKLLFTLKGISGYSMQVNKIAPKVKHAAKIEFATGQKNRGEKPHFSAKHSQTESLQCRFWLLSSKISIMGSLILFFEVQDHQIYSILNISVG